MLPPKALPAVIAGRRAGVSEKVRDHRQKTFREWERASFPWAAGMPSNLPRICW
ncbi:hypothetical protein ASZ90_017043 [hydrocarbon metagenome]|uniref:Uncharacterized protein n=1 Tax=hydrocarbon metagenome TaxID=938273 RepID=A0A0W8EA68_9ZZZZ